MQIRKKTVFIAWMGFVFLLVIFKLDSFMTSTVQYRNRKQSPNTKVILFTYMRSGSSFTGSVLSKHPNVFYVFEPLKYANHPLNTHFSYFNKTTIYLEASEKQPLLRQVISSFMNCRAATLDLGTLNETFISRNGVENLRTFHRCFQQFDPLKCVSRVDGACSRDRTVLVKTIRLPMGTALDLLEEDPDVKIIYLLRDPRATIKSQSAMLYKKYDNFSHHVTTVCDRMLTDLKIFEDILKPKYPDRVKAVLYENLSDNPVSVSRALYAFLDLPFTSTVEDHIRNITSGTGRCGLYCKPKLNSSQNAQAWRQSKFYPKAKLIDSQCSRVYQYLGYDFTPGTLSEFTNTSILLHSLPRI